MEKIELIESDIARTLDKIVDRELKYELRLLISEYKKIIDKKLKEAARPCKKTK